MVARYNVAAKIMKSLRRRENGEALVCRVGTKDPSGWRTAQAGGQQQISFTFRKCCRVYLESALDLGQEVVLI